MPTPRRDLPIALAILLTGAAVPAAQAADGDAATWILAPYIWAPDITAELDTPRGTVGGGGTSFFPDIVDRIEGAFLGHAEAQGDTFGFLADVVYLKLGDSKEFAIGNTDADLKTWLIDVAGVWSPGAERLSGFELLAGLRYIDISLDASLDPTDPALARREIGLSSNYSDFLLGARYLAHFNENWSLTLKADGSWGETDGTYSLAGTFGWSPGNGIWAFGWRYMQADFEKDNADLSMDLSGPLVGYAFVF